MRQPSLDTAAQRMAERYPHARLLPGSPDDFAAWLDHHGIDSDSELAEEMREAAAELCGWTEIEGKKAGSERRPALHPEMAAKRFIDWLHVEGREGAYLAADLESLYHEHAGAIGHEPTPQSPLRQALKAMGIVSETIKTGHRAGNRKERRIRSVQWRLFKTVASPQRIPNQAVARLAEKLADRVAA